MEWFKGHAERLNIQGNILRFWNHLVAGAFALALLLQVIGWVYAWVHLQAWRNRYITGIISLVLNVGACVLQWMVGRGEPHILSLFGLQLLSLVGLSFTSIAAGTAAINVDVCVRGLVVNNTGACPAYDIEYAGCIIACLCLGAIFFATQQKIVLLVDRGILTGIGARLSKI
jgi:hypothetical protein